MFMLTAFADVCSMAVDPEWQGRGIGKLLLAEDCKRADQAGQDIYLESTVAGKRLYQSLESVKSWMGRLRSARC
jgi:ribosomal protein S18 acetylase RimI-like enzyme